MAVEGQTVAFTLLGDERFTYTVAAPSAEGSYSFSGVLLDANKAEQAVGGDSTIRVGPPPTPTPEPTANADARAYAHADARTYAHAGRPTAYAHAGAHGRRPQCHAGAHADGHAHAGASDRHTLSHRGAGTHPHVGSHATASGAGTRGRPATRVDLPG